MVHPALSAYISQLNFTAVSETDDRKFGLRLGVGSAASIILVGPLLLFALFRSAGMQKQSRRRRDNQRGHGVQIIVLAFGNAARSSTTFCARLPDILAHLVQLLDERRSGGFHPFVSTS
jgi:hypothetical protein